MKLDTADTKFVCATFPDAKSFKAAWQEVEQEGTVKALLPSHSAAPIGMDFYGREIKADRFNPYSDEGGLVKLL